MKKLVTLFVLLLCGCDMTYDDYIAALAKCRSNNMEPVVKGYHNGSDNKVTTVTNVLCKDQDGHFWYPSELK